MATTICKIQLGKNGLNEGFFETLKNNFKNHQNVKVCVMKSAGHDKASVKEYGDIILNKMGPKYTGRVVGFTIFLKKWRKNKR